MPRKTDEMTYEEMHAERTELKLKIPRAINRLAKMQGRAIELEHAMARKLRELGDAKKNACQ